MLDHPEEMFANYYRSILIFQKQKLKNYRHLTLSSPGPHKRYYARRLAPRVDIRIVLVALVTIVSALQYYIAWFNFEAAISHLATVPKYRLQVKPLTLLGRVEQFVNLSSLGHAHCCLKLS